MTEMSSHANWVALPCLRLRFFLFTGVVTWKDIRRSISTSRQEMHPVCGPGVESHLSKEKN